MSLREVEGPAGAPWERPMHGSLDRLVVESEILAGNPLGDPTRRPLWVYRPPGVERDHPRLLPVIYLIQGYTGQLDMWLRRDAFEPTVIERFDALFAGEKAELAKSQGVPASAIMRQTRIGSQRVVHADFLLQGVGQAGGVDGVALVQAYVPARDARVIFRTAGPDSPLPRKLPADVLAPWIYLEQESKAWHAKDRSSIYGGFHMYARRPLS